MAAELAALLQERQTGPVHIVGLSMGGVIAQQFALDFPALTRKLVLVSTFSVLRPKDLSQWWYFLQRLLVVHLVGMESQARIVARRVFPHPGQEALREMAAAQIARSNPRAYCAAMRQLAWFDSRPRLHELRVPVLVVTGGRDTTVSPERQRLLAEAIRGARQVLLPEGGHALSIDQAEAFNRVLLEFLR